MSEVRHPAFPDIVRDVDDVDRWVRAGWVRVDDEQPTEPTEPEPERPKRHRRK